MAFLRTTRFSQQEEISCDGNSDRSVGMISREIIEVLNGGFFFVVMSRSHSLENTDQFVDLNCINTFCQKPELVMLARILTAKVL